MKNLIIASTSTLHGGNYLDYLLSELKLLYSDADEILFIPYARPGGISHEAYTERAAKVFKTLDKSVKGIHQFENAGVAVSKAQGIFIGGGNTFVLVNQLYRNQLIEPLQKRIESGTPYLGTSAGSNICGLTMSTTNDMPIVQPPSFKTLASVPFNINPHYLDPDPNSKHMGETRETRIREFHQFNTQPVVGLREGSFLRVRDGDIVLKGALSARIFEYGKEPFELESGSSLKGLK